MITTNSGLGVSWREIPKLQMSSVWSAAWKMFSQNSRLFVSIVLVETALIMPSNWALFHFLLDHGHPPRISTIVLSITWMILIGVLCQALLTLCVFQKCHRQPATISANLQRVVSRAVPLLFTALFVGVAVFAGFVLLIIPAFIVMTVYSVAVAACAVQETGPRESLSQSAGLTRFHRWQIFGLGVEFGIISVVLNQIVEMVWVRALGQSATSLSLAVIDELVAVLPLAFYSVAWAIIYCQLRSIKDGELAPLAP